MPNLRNGTKGGFEPGLTRLRVRRSTTELPRITWSKLMEKWSASASVDSIDLAIKPAFFAIHPLLFGNCCKLRYLIFV